MEETLQRDIDRIRGKITEMAGRAERALKDGLQSLQERNRQRAYAIILRDQYIDELEKEIDRLCLEFLVRQQPVASHLRFVYAAIKINAELERIGDYAESIARQILKISSLEPQPRYDRFVEIANLSIPMLHDAVRSFLDQNADLARTTMATEEKVDTLRDQINGELLRAEQKREIPLEAFTPLMMIARRYERVSDQAKNICEEVVYMCTGEYAKHKGADVFRILFVDEHNSCRSQIAEGIGNALGRPKLVFSSAGLEPQGLDPATVRFLAEKGIDISRHTPRAVGQVPNLESYQVVIALTKAALTTCLLTPAKTVKLDWNVKDPSKMTGTPAEVRAAYEETFQYIQSQIHDLAEAILGDTND